MSRRRRPEKRVILPDPKFGDQVLSKFMNNLMLDGKKSVAEGIVYSALETVEAKAKAIEEEVEDIAAHALPIMAVEQIASKLEEDKKKAEADEKAKVASSVDKTHPDPFHHLKSMFGL